MAISWDDFDKIWASTSPLTPYNFSEVNYKQGWNFVGATPPARQMWDSIQKANDEKFKFLRDNFGTPNMVTTAAQMTDTDKIYVYVGSEAGWNNGHWYYYDAGTSAWVDGGVYNSTAFVTDTTLTEAGKAADAEAVGDALALKADLAGATFTGNVTANGNLSVVGNATLNGTSTAVTPAKADNSTNIATTAYVQGELTNYLPLSGGAGAHNSIYRGKYLGDHVTDEQYDAIDAGTFEGLFIGDYWVINGVNWRIAAFDYWLNCGDTKCTTHHVVIVPDTNLATCQMNDSNVTTGAYIGSNYYTGENSNTGNATANTAINNAFGSSHILTHRELLANAVTNGYESAGSWYDSKFELMTEEMVYGGTIFHNIVNGTNVPFSYTIDKSQLPLFALEPSRITNRAPWWLRDVVSATNFANVAGNGSASHAGASISLGVRPAFAIKK